MHTASSGYEAGCVARRIRLRWLMKPYAFKVGAGSSLGGMRTVGII
ncbi:hypothetical protein [Bacteroides sp. An322]|nr:hypothetical protein [Bacteroides sp. An322]HJC98579.1 hypothetical protein [Candidatus Phocaeicola merdavium]